MFSFIKKCIPQETRIWMRGWKQYFTSQSLFTKTQKHYRELEKSIFSKDKITVASYVVFDSTFGGYGLMDLWMKDERYDPKIVIIPDVTRGKDAMLRQYKQTKTFFVNKYGSEYVVDGYDAEKDIFLDPSASIDIVYMANPYDGMVNRVHSIAYLSEKNVLPFIINYCYPVDYYSVFQVIQNEAFSLCWKVFAETRYVLKDFRKFQLIHGRNVVLSGYPKMDDLNSSTKQLSEKKRIILAPHHTVKSTILPLSNFLSYAELIKKLPELFPQVTFVFRPHPLLFTNMVHEHIWTQNQVDAYIADLQKKGVEYSYGGDYLKIFKNSDALIHDCGSFLVEYLFTGNPCCFVSKKDNKKFINPFGMKCLSLYTRAWSEQDIIRFIDDVVNERHKPAEMPAWFKKNVAVNYPDASGFIFKHLLEPVK